MSKPFESCKVYYSGSIKGASESNQNLPLEIVKYMQENGATVLSEHVAYSNREEMNEIFARNTNTTIEELKNDKDIQFRFRRQDMEWVNQATHFIALVNAPSHGVGMEIQRAIDKPLIGKNPTPILCLVENENLNSLSSMIRGVSVSENNHFNIETYIDFNDIKSHIFDVLTTRIDSK